MRRHDEMRLRTAVQALQGDAPDAAQLDAAAKRVAGRLGIDVMDDSVVDIIENCGDVQHLLASYRAGTLSSARRLLIEDHLRDCGACLRRFRDGRKQQCWTGLPLRQKMHLSGPRRHSAWQQLPVSHFWSSRSSPTKPIGRPRRESEPKCNRSTAPRMAFPMQAIASCPPATS